MSSPQTTFIVFFYLATRALPGQSAGPSRLIRAPIISTEGHVLKNLYVSLMGNEMNYLRVIK